MTDIEQKALALVNGVKTERGRNSYSHYTRLNRALDDGHEALCRAIDQLEDLRVEADAQYDRGYYDGCIRQPRQSNIFDACDVQKHTLIVDQDYASHTIKVKSLKDSQPTQSDVSFRELAAVLYRKSADFQVGLTVADSYTLAAEAIAFLQEQNK